MTRYLPLPLLFLLSTPAWSAPPAPEPPTAEELAGIMRTLFLSAMPSPLIDQSHNWGHQKQVTNGITWEKDGVLLKPHKQKKMKNDGTWRKIRVETVDPEKQLRLVVQNVQKPEKGKLTFDMIVTVPAKIHFEQQIWKSGVRLYSGHTRARIRPILFLRCESTTRTVKSHSFIPDVVFRLRVLEAKLTYEGFVVEHTAGVGGDLAKMIGEAAHETVKQVRPSLEKNMLEKANKAIVKAGDTKEVRLGLGKLLEGK